ncbi:DUF397 domain-containing protein [Streptomyces sp. NPDC088348]|uniref:DUF397 domain-containing protein n=1 Tax=Streptomyces sp. NPDC088348 TaxID=3365853 RepID=UPI0038097481
MKVFRFVKSSYSADSADCVEVACNVSGTVAVRDSKDTAGPVILLNSAAWDAFRSGLTGSGRRY